ncbi:hypothetical protein MES5069_1340013 [Mesorhizobium escarrei]|uniref:Uncharacterized protein n=1 Tax=Mesorhizobium escarrei TaxID=666018 RepID=A0ABM9DIS1_9HYPH|nr:hypothetical protein MES5069_1340013 [Mesorhizobium escarrei]
MRHVHSTGSQVDRLVAQRQFHPAGGIARAESGDHWHHRRRAVIVGPRNAQRAGRLGGSLREPLSASRGYITTTGTDGALATCSQCLMPHSPRGLDASDLVNVKELLGQLPWVPFAKGRDGIKRGPLSFC